MNIVLTCINNYQDYIQTNIKQLIKLNHKNIFVICNSFMFNYFEDYGSNVTLIDVNELDKLDGYDNIDKIKTNSSLDKNFRGGFWYLSSLRFLYIYKFMDKYNIDNVIHLENDVLIYYNCDEFINLIDKRFLYIPFDTYKRNIASIVYIPNKEVYKQIIDNYDFNKNDMENFSIIKQKTGLIENLPIFINSNFLSNEQQFVSKNSNIFPFIFDAAAIGQYLGGVDPRNISGNTIGFINETCVIKYNNYYIEFQYDENNCRKPFIFIENKCVPIFNLHIHSKKLEDFI